MAWLASLLLHALLVLAYFGAGGERRPPQATAPEQPAIEIEVVADPSAGEVAADEAPEETPEQAAAPTPPPEPAAEADTVPAPPPPPPAPPSPPAPPATARLPPAHLPSGASAEGRADGLTDIVLGENTVPPGEDPSAQNIPPRYPPEAARRGQQGTVQLSVVVATDGSALSVDVAVSSGYPLLDRAARDAVAKWRFRPGSLDGMAMPATLPVTLQFTLIDRR